MIVATAAVPPALAVLSSGDVHWRDDYLQIGIHATSKIVSHLNGAFSMLVPLAEKAVRVEAVDASAESYGLLALIRGRVVGVRPTAEPPWILESRFRPATVSDDPRLQGHVDYWVAMRAWLEGQEDSPPPPPTH